MSFFFFNFLSFQLNRKLSFFFFLFKPKLGNFRINDTDYFIEPDVDFRVVDAARNNKNLKKTEVSYALIDEKIVTFQTHIIYTKAYNTKTTNLIDSCILLGEYI